MWVPHSYYVPKNKCVAITQPWAHICDTPAMIQMSVNIHNCCISVCRTLSRAATIQLATAKGLAEGQAVLDGHHIVKHRVHCAGEVVETTCKTLANIDRSTYLIHLKIFPCLCMYSVAGYKIFCNCNSYKYIYYSFFLFLYKETAFVILN